VRRPVDDHDVHLGQHASVPITARNKRESERRRGGTETERHRETQTQTYRHTNTQTHLDGGEVRPVDDHDVHLGQHVSVAMRLHDGAKRVFQNLEEDVVDVGRHVRQLDLRERQCVCVCVMSERVREKEREEVCVSE
jgi:hypothetical protein